MFREWGFLLTEIWVLLALSALLGLFVGWLIWARNKDAERTTILETELNDCRDALDQCRQKSAKMQNQLSVQVSKPQAKQPVKIAAKAKTPVSKKAGIAQKPVTLKKPRKNKADDLKRIKGVGPKLESLVNKLGFYHFDQIAMWSSKEISWVDENLEGLKGRVSRDQWVSQAKTLARGGETKFSKKVDKGGVY